MDRRTRPLPCTPTQPARRRGPGRRTRNRDPWRSRHAAPGIRWCPTHRRRSTRLAERLRQPDRRNTRMNWDTIYHVLATIAQIGFWVYVPATFLLIGFYAGERHERGRHRD